MIKKHDDIIIETLSRLLTPFIQAFALYVLSLGHYGPGGGFQGGVLVTASFILLIIAFDMKKTTERFSEKFNVVCNSAGVLIYAGIGILCILLGGNLLDYSFLSKILPVGLEEARSLGILGVEIGVAVSVSACLLSIFLDLASNGKKLGGS
ncbi:MAG: MnhB domain-containing protein [Thermodesulfobacteriota bacterium]|nr:MnhB domain-containing protein [Thermodesulfobacteriota bacterium]